MGQIISADKCGGISQEDFWSGAPLEGAVETAAWGVTFLTPHEPGKKQPDGTRVAEAAQSVEVAVPAIALPALGERALIQTTEIQQ